MVHLIYLFIYMFLLIVQQYCRKNILYIIGQLTEYLFFTWHKILPIFISSICAKNYATCLSVFIVALLYIIIFLFHLFRKFVPHLSD